MGSEDSDAAALLQGGLRTIELHNTNGNEAEDAKDDKVDEDVEQLENSTAPRLSESACAACCPALPVSWCQSHASGCSCPTSCSCGTSYYGKNLCRRGNSWNAGTVNGGGIWGSYNGVACR